MNAPPERTALYRLYDTSGTLLYVGVTNDLRRRGEIHSNNQPWWHLVAGQRVEWFPDRLAAEAAEVTAIKDESPRFNIDHALNPRYGQDNYDDTADRRRVRRLLRRDAKNNYFYVGRTVHSAALAERYEVSVRTVLSEMERGNEGCFTSLRRRITVLRTPTF